MRTILFALPFALAAAIPVAAQSPLAFGAGESGGASLEVVRAEGDRAESSVAFVAAHVRLAPRLALVGDVPLARASYTRETVFYITAPCPSPDEPCGPAPSAGATAVGNPYLGLRVGAEGGVWHQEVGVRLPAGQLAGRDADVLDLVQEVAFERADAFAEGGVTVLALTGVEVALSPQIGLRARVGGLARLGTREGAGLLDAQVAGSWRAVRLAATSHFRVGLSEGYRVAGEAWGALVGAEAALQLGDIRPALYLRTPIGGTDDGALGPRFGLSLSVAVNR